MSDFEVTYKNTEHIYFHRVSTFYLAFSGFASGIEGAQPLPVYHPQTHWLQDGSIRQIALEVFRIWVWKLCCKTHPDVFCCLRKCCVLLFPWPLCYWDHARRLKLINHRVRNTQGGRSMWWKGNFWQSGRGTGESFWNSKKTSERKKKMWRQVQASLFFLCIPTSAWLSPSSGIETHRRFEGDKPGPATKS